MSSSGEVAPQRDAFIRDLLDRAAQIRMPELFAGHPDAFWHVANRHGVSVIALRTASLSTHQLMNIMTYRLVQYLLANQLDANQIFRDRIAHEPLTNVATQDVHVLAGTADNGEILSYVTLEYRADAEASTTLAAHDRPLLPVEQIFGWGVFNRLRLLRDLPLIRVRELGRFSKNQQRDPQDELSIRGTVELVHGIMSLLSGPLRREVDACVGDIEEGVAKKNLDYFHVSTAVVHGVVPYAPEGSYAFRNYQTRTRYPFAFLSSEISVDRLAKIERALALPHREGLIALLALKGEPPAAPSSLEVTDGSAALIETPVPEQGGPMPVRRHLLEVGDWLRSTNFFHDLSVAEAAVLGTFMEQQTAAAGDTIVRQGDAGDDLYLIESGRAVVQVVGPTGQRTIVGERGPADCFGEIALVTGGERTADVIALTPMTLMRLSHDAYARYLAHLVDVDNQITHTALERTRDTLRVLSNTTSSAAPSVSPPHGEDG